MSERTFLYSLDALMGVMSLMICSAPLIKMYIG